MWNTGEGAEKHKCLFIDSARPVDLRRSPPTSRPRVTVAEGASASDTRVCLASAKYRHRDNTSSQEFILKSNRSRKRVLAYCRWQILASDTPILANSSIEVVHFRTKRFLIFANFSQVKSTRRKIFWALQKTILAKFYYSGLSVGRW